MDEDADRHVQCHILRHHKQACQGERACFPGLLHWCFKEELDLLKHFRVRSKNAARGPSQPVLSHAVQTFCIQHWSVTVVLVLDLVLVLLLLLRLLLLVAARTDSSTRRSLPASCLGCRRRHKTAARW
jgi:hypothetical protein